MENPSHRFIATEIEVAGVRTRANSHTYRVVRKWGGAIVGDGSVPGGFEINTAPAAGDIFIQEIREICDALDEDEAFATNEAGAHVHIDARDFKFYDMRRLVFLYEKLEAGLYGLVAPYRVQSQYCRPCGTIYSANLRKGLVPKENKKVILKNVFNVAGDQLRQVPEMKRTKHGPRRYYGLNLHSWLHRGTIECRIMHGSTEPDKLIGWGTLWASILDYAMKHTETQLNALNKRPIDLLLDIAPTEKLKQWVDNRWAFFHRTRR